MDTNGGGVQWFGATDEALQRLYSAIAFVKQHTPVAIGRGESGRDSVGDGVPTAKLRLLLFRALGAGGKQQE